MKGGHIRGKALYGAKGTLEGGRGHIRVKGPHTTVN